MAIKNGNLFLISMLGRIFLLVHHGCTRANTRNGGSFEIVTSSHGKEQNEDCDPDSDDKDGSKPFSRERCQNLLIGWERHFFL
jgi:hypothetical protein